MRKTAAMILLAVAAGAGITPAADEAPPVRIYLPRGIKVSGESLKLEQIGVVLCDDGQLEARARAVAMGRSPWPREQITIDRTTVLSRLAASGIEMIIQTGRDELLNVRESCRAAGATAVVERYFDNVADAYAACDLVISRAGATTLAETAAVARPAILVPYPYATEGHQMKNARAVEAAGAAVVIPDGELAGGSLARRIQELLRDRTRLERMAHAARALARPDAARRVAESVLALARGRSGA